MTIDQRFLLKVKHVHFDQFDFFGHFSVYTSDENPYAQNRSKILKSELWTYVMG